MSKVDSLGPWQRATYTQGQKLCGSFVLFMPSRIPKWRNNVPISPLLLEPPVTSFLVNCDCCVSCRLWLINNGIWDDLINSQEERKPTSLFSEQKQSFLEGQEGVCSDALQSLWHPGQSPSCMLPQPQNLPLREWALPDDKIGVNEGRFLLIGNRLSSPGY